MLTATVLLLFQPHQKAKADALVHKMVKRAIELEGTVTVRIQILLGVLGSVLIRRRVNMASVS